MNTLLVILLVIGGQETYSDKPISPNGKIASVNAPANLHVKNTGGSDGQGLCVIASVLLASRCNQRGDAEILWTTAKKRPGGYWPAKFERLALDCGFRRWASYEGTDIGVIQRLTAAGHAVMATVDYNDKDGFISHAITIVHCDGEWTCYVDNNRPGTWVWLPTSVYVKRATVNTKSFWVIAIESKEEKAVVGSSVVIFVVAGLLAIWMFRK